jgi:N-acetylglucosaminyldiphosphoundecaprenol N-acetyl-beta-D-mannosaminyltransferase
MEKTHILGIPIDILNKEELVKSIYHLLRHRQGHIVTLNPEFLLLAQKNQEFFWVLNQATLSVPDGIGLKFAGWLRGVNLLRYSGANLVNYLLKLAYHKHLRVAVINWKKGLSSDEDILQAVKKLYPHLKFLVLSMDRGSHDYDLKNLKAFQPDIVFVALGAPWQDVFIKRRLFNDLPNIKIAMGVGGSFDFLTNKIKRAPKLFQKFGLEWLWRLIMQPWRIKRIYKAVIVFTYKAITWEFKRFFYRNNVVAMIINSLGEVLILNSAGSRNYWGLPQGGVDSGEKLEEALRREVKEETNLEDLEVILAVPHIYKYNWPKYYTHSGYKGQKQSLFILKYGGERRTVRLNPIEHKSFRWIKIKDLVFKTSPAHREQYTLFLEKYNQVKDKFTYDK